MLGGYDAGPGSYWALCARYRGDFTMSGYFIMYLRKSRADAEKERYAQYETLAIHEEQLTKLAKSEHLPVAEVYRELVSGETIEARTEFKKVMNRIADPECEGVIVHAVDRLGRGDPLEYGWILSAFRFSKTLIVTPGRTYDPNNATDLQQLKMQMFVSNMEFEHIRERLVDGSVRSAERGNYVGSKAPYGYDRNLGRKPSIVPSEAEAPVVRRMFRMAADGSNKGMIARSLNADGIRARHGGTWTAARIGAILSNPVYKGWVRYGYRRQKVVGRDGMRFIKKTKVSAEGEYVFTQGVHEPLVSDDLWERAQQAFEASPVTRDRTMKNPLSGLVVCGKCGRALVRQVVKIKSGRRYPRLHHCYNTDCHCRSSALDDVVDAVCDALAQTARDLEMGVVRCGADPDEIRALERAIAEEDRRLDKLLELFYADAIDVREFKRRREASEDVVKRMRERHDELSAKSVDPVAIAATTRSALLALKDDSVSAEAKNDLLKSFVERIDYWREDKWGGRIRLAVHLRGID